MPRRLLFLPLALLLGCDGRGAAADHARDGAQAEPPGGALVRPASGGAPLAGGAAARALPAGLALYPGAAVTSAIVTSPTEGGATTLGFTSADALGTVAAFYRAAAARAGYTLDAEVAAEGLAMLSGRRADGTDFSLTLTPEGKGTSGTLTGGAAPPGPKAP